VSLRPSTVTRSMSPRTHAILVSSAAFSISPVISSVVCWTNRLDVDRGFRTCSSASRLAKA